MPRGARPLRALGRWRVPGRVLRLGALAVLGLIVLGAAIVAARYQGPVRAILAGRADVVAAKQQLSRLADDPSQARIDAAGAELTSAAAAFGPQSERLHSGLEARLLRRLPVLGRQLRGVDDLRTSGAAAIDSARNTLPLLRELTAKSSTGVLERVVSALDRQPDLLRAEQLSLDRLSLGLLRLRNDGPLWGKLGTARDDLLEQGGQVLHNARTAVDLASGLQRATGGATKKRYLVLLGNPAEIRPGGGFVGVVGTVEVKGGRVLSTRFRDSYFANDKVRDLKAPRPLDYYLFAGRPWELPDTNWSPHFPTSAKDASMFYTRATGERLDGVLSIDTTAIGRILKVLGPLRVPPYPQVITADNILRELTMIANKIRPSDPGKDFLVKLGGRLVTQVTTAPTSKAVALGRALAASVPAKNLTMSVQDPVLEEVLDRHLASGKVLSPPGEDRLLVVDANLSGGKNDLFVSKSASLDVKRTSGGLRHVLALRYRQPKATTLIDRRLQPGSGGAYRDYVRVYAPGGAQLQSMTVDGKPSGPEDVTTEQGRSVFAFFLVVPQGKATTVTFTYVTTGTRPGSLLWEKPLGALPHEVSVTADWGAGVVRRSAPLDHDLLVTAG